MESTSPAEAAQHALHSDEPVYARTLRLASSLERLHADLQAGPLRHDMRMRVIGMAQVIAQAAKEAPDALLAGLHTNRSHSYLVVQQLLGAAVVELLAADADVDEQLRTSWVCAALTRDVGMIGLQQQLDAQATPLTPRQQDDIQNHTVHARALLMQMGVKDPAWLRVVDEHHERCDGSGYPQHLHGAAMCEGARLLAVADSYAAMVTPRAIRVARPPLQAMQALYIERDTGYDSTWVQRLIRVLTPYPPGSLVALRNGEQALVRSRQHQAHGMEVWAVQSRSGAWLQPPQRRRTSEPDCAIEQPLCLLHTRYGAVDLAALWMLEAAGASA